MHPQCCSLMSTGSTILQGHAHIETPAVRIGDLHWLSMNGVIFVKGDTEDEKVFCRFTCFHEDTRQDVPAGTYDIMATVRFTGVVNLRNAYATMAQVVGTHEEENGTLFKLQGDIFSVCPS